jgi:hypothetical protein
MKRLAILIVVLGVIAVPAQAETQKPAAPVGFNGLVWDTPVQSYGVPHGASMKAAAPAPRGPASQAPVGFNGLVWDPPVNH